jgi:ABC-type transport system involved in multi-copper enzyme maturation permease subunit
VKVYAIALNTFREMIRNRILYALVLFGFFLILVAAILATASVGDTTKFIQDFGLLSISLICVISATTAGASLVGKEIGKKTIYNILSKPISRRGFLLGKYLGLCSTLTLLSLLMTACLILFLALFDQKIHWHLMSATYFIFFEILLVAVIALFFSALLVTPTVVALSVVGVFIAGRSFGDVEEFFGPADSTFGKFMLSILGIMLPRLDWLAPLSDRIVYREPVPSETFLVAPFYTLTYCAFVFVLASLIFERREF